MLSKWMNDFDFDKDKTRLKLLDINLWWFQSFALILDPGHLMTKRSWLAWDVQCTVSGWRTSREWSPGCGQIWNSNQVLQSVNSSDTYEEQDTQGRVICSENVISPEK